MAGKNVWVTSGSTRNIIVDAITASTGSWHYKDSPYASFQVTLTGDGAVDCDVDIEVSNDGSTPLDTPLASVLLSGTDATSDGFTTVAPWKYVRAKINSISGTGATINVIMGV